MKLEKLCLLLSVLTFTSILFCKNNSADNNNFTCTKNEFIKLDSAVQTWWDNDIYSAREEQICKSNGVLFLPFPYTSAGGSEQAFREMYGWDTYFINMALLAHGRVSLVRDNILNHLFMIERYGHVLNANNINLASRAQPPLLAESVIMYFHQTNDTSLLMMAYPLLKKEYEEYWNCGRHLTPVGLSTCFDSTDPNLKYQLASEAETGLDFVACYAGNVTECVPLHINCILVKYEKTLAEIAAIFGLRNESETYSKKALLRAELINKFCWNEQDEMFYEYNYKKQEQIKVKTLCAYWTIWAGITDSIRAEKLVNNLHYFELAHGLTFTSEDYPSPYSEFKWLQWGYPSGWPPMHIITVEALKKAGFENDAKRIAEKYVSMVIHLYQETGKLWERYNVSDGSIKLPEERDGYGINPLHGWSSSAAVLLGRYLYDLK